MGARRLPVVCEASAMATRMCPQCGSQYVASVRRCIDCDEMLVDQPSESAEGEATSSSTPLGDGDQVAYELAGWSNQLKVTLEGMLDKAGIRRVWEAGALVVPASDEAEVDVLVATVEGGDEVALATEVEQVAFEIEGLTADELVDLDARLIAAQIAHAWEDTGALLVAVDDEDVVAEMIDDVLSEEADEGGVDGLATHQALTELYVAVDKLLKDPTDGKLVRRYGAAAEQLDAGGCPTGCPAARGRVGRRDPRPARRAPGRGRWRRCLGRRRCARSRGRGGRRGRGGHRPGPARRPRASAPRTPPRGRLTTSNGSSPGWRTALVRARRRWGAGEGQR